MRRPRASMTTARSPPARIATLPFRMRPWDINEDASGVPLPPPPGLYLYPISPPLTLSLSQPLATMPRRRCTRGARPVNASPTPCRPAAAASGRAGKLGTHVRLVDPQIRLSTSPDNIVGSPLPSGQELADLQMVLHHGLRHSIW